MKIEPDNTLNWWQYWIGHCWMTGWQSIGSTFRIWRDLMTSNYEGYALLKEDDPEAECLDWFWTSLNEDDVYSKEFLEYLQDMVDRIDKDLLRVIEYDVEEFEKDMKTLEEWMNED